MLKLRVSLAIALSTTILGGVLLSSVPANACPYAKSNPTAVSRNKSSDSPFGNSTNSGRSIPRNGSTIDTTQANLNQGSTTDLRIAGAGMMAIAGFFVLGLLQRVRRFNEADATLHEILERHPEVEHPELMLTGLPQEGCSSKSEEIAFVR